MKIVTANDKKKLVMSRVEWEAMGKKAGWTEKINLVKEAGQTGDTPRFGKEYAEYLQKLANQTTELATALNALASMTILYYTKKY